jgi:hypothetical protein
VKSQGTIGSLSIARIPLLSPGDSRAFFSAPFLRRLVHVLFEETVEVLHRVVTKERCDCTDFRGWENAQQSL